RVEEALIQQRGRHLICYGARRLDEHLIRDSGSFCREYGHSDGRKDVEVVRLPRQESQTIKMDRRKLDAGRIDCLAIRPGVGLLGRAFDFLGWVRKREDHRSRIDAWLCLANFPGESAANGTATDYRSRLDALDSGDEIPGRGMLVSIRLLEVDEVGSTGFEQAIDVEHVDPRLSLLTGQPFVDH